MLGDLFDFLPIAAAGFAIPQFLPQLTKTAHRTPRPTGISRGTWLLVLGELSCWTAFGLHQLDPRLIILGCTGVVASMGMLARIFVTRAVDRPVPADAVPAVRRTGVP